jgi:PRC-barrel domain
MDHPRPGLRYVDAGDLDGSFQFDGLEVDSYTDEKLGTVDGFIIDVNSARPYYVVVDAGGWFTSKYFLLPIGHAGLDVPGNKLIADISKDHVSKYPGFDRDVFNDLSSAELDRLDRQTAKACCPEDSADNDTDFARRYETWKHYQNATWWDSSFYRPDRADRNISSMSSAGIAASKPAGTSYREELVTARDKDADQRLGDVSPHLGSRAQPGDVLGLETGGEQTHVGDTTEDENDRRRDAEKTAAKRDRP